jgi:diguanylate cyclase (GGDEF)-like protein
VHGPDPLAAPEFEGDLRALGLDVEDADEVPADYIADRALAAVVTNLLPAPFLVVGFVAVVSVILRAELQISRAVPWLMLTLAASSLTVLAVYVHQRNAVGRIPVWQVWNLRVALLLNGAVFGMAPWTTGRGEVVPTLMFTLFPAVAGAVVAVITAGRRDLYLCFAGPATVLSMAALVSTGEPQLRSMAFIVGFYAIALVVLHQVVSVSTTRAIRLQWRSDQLLSRQTEDREQLREANARLEATANMLHHQATHDPLTGLVNRRGTIEELDRMLPYASTAQPVSVLFCDLDLFRAVNQALGHRGGDTFLRTIAARLSREIDSGCVAGRLGGDEFVVILPNVEQGQAASIASRIVSALAQPVHAEGRDVPSSISIGVATSPQHGRTSSDLLRNANAALYRAKDGGRNRVEIFDGVMQAQLLHRVEAEQELRRALDAGEIHPFFQPEIDATNRTVVGAELLARWVKRDGTVAAAADFIDVAVQAGLLDKITEVVLTGAQKQMERLALLGLPEGFRFRVNIAPDGNDRTWRYSRLDELLRGLDPNLLIVDIREASVSSDVPAAAGVLAEFRARGGRVCLDDFARGVSSLSLLRRVPIDEVRIDRLSIDTITTHPHDRVIVRAIIALVSELGLTVTADGVETAPQADALLALGCVRQQGFLYAPALSFDRFEDFLLQRMADDLVRRQHDHDWQSADFG